MPAHGPRTRGVGGKPKYISPNQEGVSRVSNIINLGPGVLNFLSFDLGGGSNLLP